MARECTRRDAAVPRRLEPPRGRRTAASLRTTMWYSDILHCSVVIYHIVVQCSNILHCSVVIYYNVAYYYIVLQCGTVIHYSVV
jgi:hypothetical protein